MHFLDKTKFYFSVMPDIIDISFKASFTNNLLMMGK